MIDQQATLMNKKICSLALGLALVSLSGCGLKGPLYFPPADSKATPEQRQKDQEHAQQQAEAQQEMEQSTTPDRNDRGTTDGPTQVIY